ncbi:DNA repair protein rad50, partial [Quaeritorhiza haematococci]
MDELTPSIIQTEEELRKYREQMSVTESDYMKEVNVLQQSWDRVRAIEGEIERYITQGGPNRLTTCDNGLTSLETTLTTLKSRMAGVATSIESVKKQVSEVQVIQRNVDDNLKYRRMRREVKECEERIKELGEEARKVKRAMGGSGGISVLYKRLKDRHEELVGERAGLVGELKQLEEQGRQYVKELNSDYNEIDEKYRQCCVKVKTGELAHTDLDKYSKALDNAIMKFHSLKMEEINRTIRQLWGATYRGSDIETIKIRSDHDGSKSVRNYNYRVVMVKGDTELDMRGRCSAGQRVLCSLIVRLALAESFGLNCGILALDEPTTNLDKSNIESLAESLAAIIQARRQQANFQLVIITHDEEFMQALGKSDYADSFWRVYKDE